MGAARPLPSHLRPGHVAAGVHGPLVARTTPSLGWLTVMFSLQPSQRNCPWT